MHICKHRLRYIGMAILCISSLQLISLLTGFKMFYCILYIFKKKYILKYLMSLNIKYLSKIDTKLSYHLNLFYCSQIVFIVHLVNTYLYEILRVIISLLKSLKLSNFKIVILYKSFRTFFLFVLPKEKYYKLIFLKYMYMLIFQMLENYRN